MIGAIYYFSIWLFWKILVGYSPLYTPDENKQIRNMIFHTQGRSFGKNIQTLKLYVLWKIFSSVTTRKSLRAANNQK